MHTTCTVLNDLAKTSNYYKLSLLKKNLSHLFISVLNSHYTPICGNILVCGSVRNSITLFPIIIHP